MSQGQGMDGDNHSQQSMSEASGAPNSMKYVARNSLSSQALPGGMNMFNTAQPTQVQPGLYSIETFLRDDRSHMCNLDRFVEATLPIKLNINTNSLLDLIRSYHMSSIRGITVEMIDETSSKDNNKLAFTFLPTLSSLFFLMNQSAKGQASGSSSASGDRGSDLSTSSMTQRKAKMVEFHEDLLPYKRKPLSLSMLDYCGDLMLPANAKHSTVKALQELLSRGRSS